MEEKERDTRIKELEKQIITLEKENLSLKLNAMDKQRNDVINIIKSKYPEMIEKPKKIIEKK